MIREEGSVRGHAQQIQLAGDEQFFSYHAAVEHDAHDGGARLHGLGQVAARGAGHGEHGAVAKDVLKVKQHPSGVRRTDSAGTQLTKASAAAPKVANRMLQCKGGLV